MADTEEAGDTFAQLSVDDHEDRTRDNASDLSAHSHRSSEAERASCHHDNGSTNGRPRIGSARKSSVTSDTEAETAAVAEQEQEPTPEGKSSKAKNPLKFLRRLSKNKDKTKADSQRLTKFDRILLEVKVESLPQIFITKYMGFKPCQGLWGIKHTRPLVEEMISEVTSLDPEQGEDLPLAQLKVSLSGVHVKEHSANTCTSRHVEKGLVPIEFISYGVQDVRYTRVFAFILVREMSSKSRKLECHAYVCDSTTSCRKLSLSVAMAFQEYSKSLEGKTHKFQVDLRPPEELETELKPAVPDNGEDFEV